MSLTLILGGMFAGKTTELMRRVARFESLRYTALVVNSTRDTRCGANEIGSHEGKRRLATKVDRISDACVPADTRVIAIDEGQFFPDLPLIVDFADAGYHVIVAGLNGTTEQAPFGHILSLVPHADEVVWCRALCHVCNDGTPASFSIPRDDSPPPPITETTTAPSCIRIGGSDTYQAVCRAHYRDYATEKK